MEKKNDEICHRCTHGPGGERRLSDHNRRIDPSPQATYTTEAYHGQQTCAGQAHHDRQARSPEAQG